MDEDARFILCLCLSAGGFFFCELRCIIDIILKFLIIKASIVPVGSVWLKKHQTNKLLPTGSLLSLPSPLTLTDVLLRVEMVARIAVTDVTIQAVLTFSMTTNVSAQPAFICLCFREETKSHIIYIWTCIYMDTLMQEAEKVHAIPNFFWPCSHYSSNVIHQGEWRRPNQCCRRTLEKNHKSAHGKPEGSSGSTKA